MFQAISDTLTNANQVGTILDSHCHGKHTKEKRYLESPGSK